MKLSALLTLELTPCNHLAGGLYCFPTLEQVGGSPKALGAVASCILDGASGLQLRGVGVGCSVRVNLVLELLEYI